MTKFSYSYGNLISRKTPQNLHCYEKFDIDVAQSGANRPFSHDVTQLPFWHKAGYSYFRQHNKVLSLVHPDACATDPQIRLDDDCCCLFSSSFRERCLASQSNLPNTDPWDLPLEVKGGIKNGALQSLITASLAHCLLSLLQLDEVG